MSSIYSRTLKMANELPQGSTLRRDLLAAIKMAGTWTWIMSGNTYRMKDTIRHIFGSSLDWDPVNKRWHGYYGGGNAFDQHIWTLRRGGVKVHRLRGRVEPGDPIPDLDD